MVYYRRKYDLIVQMNGKLAPKRKSTANYMTDSGYSLNYRKNPFLIPDTKSLKKNVTGI